MDQECPVVVMVGFDLGDPVHDAAAARITFSDENHFEVGEICCCNRRRGWTVGLWLS